MAQSQAPKEVLMNPSCDSYFDMVQSRKKLPKALQETLTEAFARVPVSSFPEVGGGKGEYFHRFQYSVTYYSPCSTNRVPFAFPFLL